jgi:hypothetical protein
VEACKCAREWRFVPLFASWPSDSADVGAGAVRDFTSFLVPGPAVRTHGPCLIELISVASAS